MCGVWPEQFESSLIANVAWPETLLSVVLTQLQPSSLLYFSGRVSISPVCHILPLASYAAAPLRGAPALLVDSPLTRELLAAAHFNEPGLAQTMCNVALNRPVDVCTVPLAPVSAGLCGSAALYSLASIDKTRITSPISCRGDWQAIPSG